MTFAPLRVRYASVRTGDRVIVAAVLLLVAGIAAVTADRPPQASRSMDQMPATASVSFSSVSAMGPTEGLGSSTAARGPIRVFLTQPIPRQDGAWIFRGYVRNDHQSPFTGVRMEVSFSDGSVAEHSIAQIIEPGQQVAFEFGENRPTIDGWRAKVFFQTTR